MFRLIAIFLYSTMGKSIEAKSAMKNEIKTRCA